MAAEKGITLAPVLESVLRYCLADAKVRMQKGEVVVPFSALAVKDKLFMEEHPGDEPSESFSSVRRTVSGAKGADAYGFCYDGYIEDQDGKQHDCLIAEGGVPGEEYGHAIGFTYTIDEKAEGGIRFADEPIYVGQSLNYMLYAYDLDDVLEDTSEAEETADSTTDSQESAQSNL